ncbi:hypothetical protein GG681_06590 [Epibacterium sp. SM1969]|uniref:Zinc finger CGNR domain-containing protein n=1 Tax=Tritonibacter aquimaris TaxID=2663379 RepID=A0A844AP08_9RHOB|nr:CGNR zinc finger domain-containing protein [Tritonibacter aquimaris]MQY42303.1 hypothetical protein [Tritonibacter aquimaris]
MASNLPAPYLIADHKGLEVLNSIGAPYGDEMDWLVNGAEFVSWMEAVGLLSAAQGQEVLASISAEELDAAAAKVRSLRELFRDNLHEQSETFLSKLNEIMRDVTGHYKVETHECGSKAMRFEPRYECGDDLLVRVAVEIAELICLNEGERVRQCDGPTCTYWFRDTSRNNRRRWCSMAICGNRAKVKAHRARK